MLPSPSDSEKRLVDAVLFDVDDTLVNTKGALEAAIGAVRSAYLPHIPIDQEHDMWAMWRLDRNGHYLAYTRGELSDDDQRFLRGNELHAAFGGPEIRREDLPQWLEVFWGTFCRSWQALPEVDQVLTTLRAAQIPIGVVTNAEAPLQREKFAACGIKGLDNLIVAPDTFGLPKPNPGIFHAGCALLGTAPNRTAYVGDDPVIDAQAAADAGLVGVWVARPELQNLAWERPWPPDAIERRMYRIESLTELPALLGIL